MIALLLKPLAKAHVQGHLRHLAGRAIIVSPYQTKAPARRPDDRSCELFADVAPTGNPPKPRAPTPIGTQRRVLVKPFKAALPDLFAVDSGQNGQYSTGKGRTPAPATGSKTMNASKQDELTPKKYLDAAGLTELAATAEKNPKQQEFIEKVKHYINRAGPTTVEGRQLAALLALASRVDPSVSNEKDPQTKFNQALGRAIDASDDDTTYYNALSLVAYYKRHPDLRTQTTKNKPPEEKKAEENKRLTEAAKWIERQIETAKNDPDADPEVIAVLKDAAEKLRDTTRTDLDRALWAGVLSVIGVKNATWLANALEEVEGKEFGQKKEKGVYLSVPFADKDKVKAKGAKWDPDRKKWYWPTDAGEMPDAVKRYVR